MNRLKDEYLYKRESFAMNILFHSNACPVCGKYGPDANLKRCANCRMIGYCSREHQREHWPFHKDVCKVLGNRIKQYGSVFPRKREEEIIDMESWFLRKQKLMSFVRSQLGRQFRHDEAKMLLQARSCEVCHETNPQKLVDCPDCPSASFCKKHTNSEHQENCKLTVLAHKMDYEPSAGAICNFEIFDIGANIPEDIEGVVKCYREHFNEKKNPMPVDLWSIMNAEHLWKPYTFLYGIKKLSMSRFSWNIHILGSDVSELSTAAGWEALFHHANVSKDVVITYTGPEFQDCSLSAQFDETHQCRNKTFLVNTVGKLYHDYVNCDTYTKPDVILGCNLEIYFPSIYDWASTVKEIQKLKCPFLVTAFIKNELEAVRHKINCVLDKIVEPAYFGKNPYHALISVKNLITEEFSYSGNYLMIYEKL